MKDDPLRWSYTATTRASHTCYAANAPHITCFSSFKINDISTLTNIPINALALNNIPVSPYHKPNQHKTKSLKYWELSKKLKHTAYNIKNVESLGEYRERQSV